MRESTEGNITLLLEQVRQSPEAFEHLIPLVYEDLRRIGHRQRRQLGAGGGLTLQTTALVHEAFIKLHDSSQRVIKDRRHFRRLAGHVMRHLILDHIRRRQASKRGGQWVKDDTFLEQIAAEDDESFMLEMETAMQRLEAADPRQAEIAAANIYAGYTAAEIADLLDISDRTVVRELKKARGFLAVELGMVR